MVPAPVPAGGATAAPVVSSTSGAGSRRSKACGREGWHDNEKARLCMRRTLSSSGATGARAAGSPSCSTSTAYRSPSTRSFAVVAGPKRHSKMMRSEPCKRGCVSVGYSRAACCQRCHMKRFVRTCSDSSEAFERQRRLRALSRTGTGAGGAVSAAASGPPRPSGPPTMRRVRSSTTRAESRSAEPPSRLESSSQAARTSWWPSAQPVVEEGGGRGRNAAGCDARRA